MKKFGIITTTLLLSYSIIAAPPISAEADTSSIQQVEQNITKTENKLNKVEKQIKRLEEAIKDNEATLKKTKKDIKSTKKEITQLNEDIDKLNERIENRTEILKNRAQSLQESGGVISYIDVIMGSESFGDFIDRVSAVTEIAKADSDLLEQHEKDKAELEKKQNSVKEKLTKLTDMKTELEEMKDIIVEQKKENQKLKKKLKQEQKENYNKKAQLEEQAKKAKAKAAKKHSSFKTASSKSSNSFSNHISDSTGNVSGNVSTVISAGYKYIGNSVYVFGAGRNQYDIENGRFDCSGFVSWAYSQAGISLPASTDGLASSGTRVSTSAMKPGDLVFFDTYKKDGHVGIYVGGGKFIGSQTTTGVAIANMTSGYWGKRFNGKVVRIIN